MAPASAVSGCGMWLRRRMLQRPSSIPRPPRWHSGAEDKAWVAAIAERMPRPHRDRMREPLALSYSELARPRCRPPTSLTAVCGTRHALRSSRTATRSVILRTLRPSYREVAAALGVRARRSSLAIPCAETATRALRLAGALVIPFAVRDSLLSAAGFAGSAGLATRWPCCRHHGLSAKLRSAPWRPRSRSWG